ncbi:MAG: carbohydrate kinase family protein [Chloroflexi bacterium]|nr:carbohydrate kinase family protein [Chloroflexota bacterium]
MADVLCFGNLQFDVLCRSVTTLPPPGELRMIDSIDFALSGNAGNVAAALGRLGINVELAGYSGADVVGEQFRTMLSAMGVGTAKLLRHPTVSTGTSVITLSPGGERSIIFVNGANELFDLDTVPDAWLEQTRVVYVGSIFVLPQFTGEAVGRLFTRARAHGAMTVLNICWDARGQGIPFLKPALAEVDYFILSYDEGRQLTGHTLPESIVDSLKVHTRGNVILTLGADGCCVDDKAGLQQIPALSVEATDCTGAGDAFAAGFSAGLVEGLSVYDCARLGCHVASFAVTGPSAYPRIPPLTEVKQIGKPFGQMSAKR